jgi:hypothetical protein
VSRILVTGSADGLGRLTAEALLTQGHDIVVHARNAQRAETLAPLVDCGAELMVADLADREEVLQPALELRGAEPLDVVIHNAGVWSGSPVGQGLRPHPPARPGRGGLRGHGPAHRHQGAPVAVTVAERVLATTAGVVLPVLMSVSGCGPGDHGSRGARTPSATTTPSTSGRPDAGHTRAEDKMQIDITIDDERLTATLDHSAATRDLLAQLPVTVDMIDHGGVEKTGRLPAPLSLKRQPEGADPTVGDLGYYAPGSDLVLYYGDQSYFPGIVVLGRLDGDAVERIAAVDGTVTATVTSRESR